MALLLETAYLMTAEDLQIVMRHHKFFSIHPSNHLPNDLKYDYVVSTKIRIATIMQRLQRYHTLTRRHPDFARIAYFYAQEEERLKVISFNQDFVPLDSCLEKVPRSHLVNIVRSHPMLQTECAKYLECTQIAKAVDYFHSRGFWHGALELSNIFVNPKTSTYMLGMPSEDAVGRGNDVKKLKSDIADLIFIINDILAIDQSDDQRALRSKFKRMSTEYHDSSAVLNHLQRPQLVVVTKYQPIYAPYQARRVLHSWSEEKTRAK